MVEKRVRRTRYVERLKKRRNARIKRWVSIGAPILVLVAVILGIYTFRPTPLTIAQESRPSPTMETPSQAPPIRFAAVGDSITEANSSDIIAGSVGNLSWVHYTKSASLRFVGGWADGGAPTSSMKENVTPVVADALVLVAGANDVGNGVPFESTARNLASIVETAGVSRVIISSIPPQDERPAAVAEYNTALERLADDSGWEWVDAAAELGTSDNEFITGMSSDGVHLTEKGAHILGESISQHLTN